MNKNRVQILFTILWFLFCTVLLVIPGSSFPSSNWWTKIPLFDKWVHIFLFLILTYSICLSFLGSKFSKSQLLNYFYLIGFLCFMYGIAMELIQHFFIPLRAFDFGDIIADGIGVIAGLSCFRYIQKIDPCENRGRNQN